MPGVFAGTPAFASPEQFAGAGVDIRSDLYSLGVTLWKMLTGQAPFRGSAAEVMHQHQHAPLPLEQLGGIPQPLVVLLEVLLEKDPARRFQSPAELLKVMPMVRDAIEAGSLLTKTIRVFVSSTGDVQKERDSGGPGDPLCCCRVWRPGECSSKFRTPGRGQWRSQRITERGCSVPIFWSIRGSNRTRDAGDRCRTRPNLIW